MAYSERPADPVVQSAALTVDAYFSEVARERLPAMTRIRALCRETLPGWRERMQWGMPGYGPEGADNLVSFNSQKGYIAIYPGKTALEAHRGALSGASFGAGCVRFPRPDRIDYGAVEAILRHAYAIKSASPEQGSCA